MAKIDIVPKLSYFTYFFIKCISIPMNYKIIKNGKGSSYKLLLQGEHKNILYLSLLKTELLTNSFYNTEEGAIFFTAEKVSTLAAYLDKEESLTEAKCIRMIDSLTKQIIYLEVKNYVFYGHSISDIIVINDSVFINVNSTTLLPVTNNTIVFLYPFSKPQFVSSEIKQLTKLPSEISYKSGYYSLAAIIIYCLLNEDLNEIQEAPNAASLHKCRRNASSQKEHQPSSM